MRGFIAAGVLLLSGCGVTLDGVTQKGARANDEILDASTRWLCQGASVGSLVRAYGSDVERWNAWRELCGYASPAVPPASVR